MSDEPRRGMSYEEAKAFAERPPLPLDQAFANYRAAVRAALIVADAIVEAVEHRDVTLAERLRNGDQNRVVALRQRAEREMNRSIVAEYRKEQTNGAK